MITPAQLRAARALLDWSRGECGKATGLSSETIKNIEGGRFNPSEATLGKIVQTFSKNGVEFVGIDAFSKHELNISGVALVALREPETASRAGQRP